MNSPDRRDPLLQGSPIIGRGRAPQGTWELRADHEKAEDDSTSGYLKLYIEFQAADGASVGGFGCSGVGFANDDRPIMLSVSGDKPKGSFCYVGQTIASTTRVELALTDGTSADAALVTTDLPARVWVAFADERAAPTEVRAYNDRRLLGREAIREDVPRRKGSAVWGPVDD